MLPPGSSIGGYEIEEPLGRGAMATVYRARDARRGRKVALKVIAGAGVLDERFAQRFAREARVAKGILHPNVVPVLDAGEERGQPYLVLELVPGESLEALLARAGRLPASEVARLGAGIAEGLAAVHAAGLVHRDVKPANVLLDPSGTPRLADFGLVRRSVRPAVAASAVLTEAGEVVGTPAYLSPEQVQGTGELDARADLYSLGATLFALATGEPPFAGKSDVALLRAHLMETPRRARELAPDLPEELDALIARLLAKDPAARGASAGVAEELAAIAARGEAARPRPRGALVAVACGVLALALVAGAFAFAQPARPGAPVAPPAPVPPPPPPPPGARPKAPPEAPPAWFEALPRERRPARLPEGVEPSATADEYVLARSRTALVYVPERASPGAPFFIGKYEVTCEEFERFAKAESYVTAIERRPTRDAPLTLGSKNGVVVELVAGASWRRPRGGKEPPCAPREPVTLVAAPDARAFCAWAGGRLPTPDEWKIAALMDPASGNLRRFPWGDDFPAPGGPVHGNLRDETFYVALGLPRDPLMAGYRDGHARVAPVGAIALDRSPLGLFDVVGNVSELCEHVVEGEEPSRRLLQLGLHWGMNWPSEEEKATQGLRRSVGAPDENFSSDNTGFRICVPEPR